MSSEVDNKWGHVAHGFQKKKLMMDVLDRLRQTFQRDENLSWEQRMVKSQLEKDRLPSAGCMTVEQLNLELELRGADRLSGDWTVEEKASTLRTFRQEQDPTKPTGRSGTGSISSSRWKEQHDQMAKPMSFLDHKGRGAGCLKKTVVTPTKEQTGSDEKGLRSGERDGRTKPGRVRFNKTDDFLADALGPARQRHDALKFGGPGEIHLSGNIREVNEVFLSLCSGRSLPRPRLPTVMSISQAEDVPGKPSVRHSENKCVVVAAFAL